MKFEFFDLYHNLREKLSNIFDLKGDKNSPDQTYNAIASGISFRGTNLWILICAIFIASLGLNMNSIPVIIGAMLISPLMGPIMGLGLGLGVRDFDLIKQSVKNLGVATLFGMLTSCVYFLISPIDEARSELLARTNPTIYDVMIAFFGGMAGIIATGSREKGNVIPGVAIATALMPPLCTSGYGLATGQFNFFFGAIYLYMINCVYICIATWIGIRILKIPKKITVEDDSKKRLIRWVYFLTFVTAMPSVYLTYKIIRENITQAQVSSFVSQQFNFTSTQVLKKEIVEGKDKKKTLDLTLIGQIVPQDSINIIASKMMFYGLKDMGLKVTQGYNPENNLNQEAMTTSIVQDMLKYNQDQLDQQRHEISTLKSDLDKYQRFDSIGTEISPEMKIIFPQVKDIAVARTYYNQVDSVKISSVTLAFIVTDGKINDNEKIKLKEWLAARMQTDNLKLVIQSGKDLYD